MFSPLRHLVAAALIAPIVALTAAPAAQAQQPVPAKKPKAHLRLTGQFGWGGRIDTKKREAFSGVTRTGRWFPIWIEIENLREKEPFKGTIRITPTGVEHTADRWIDMSAPVFIGPQSRTRVRFAHRMWSRHSPAGVSFRVSAIDSLTGQSPRGGVVGNLRAPAHVPDGELVVVLGGATAATLLTPIQRALGETRWGRDAGGAPGASRPVMVAPATLPSRFADYEAADVIIWPRVEGDAVMPSQVQALGEWVRAGGTLILGVGDTKPAGAILNLFPATLGAPVQIARFDSLPVDVDARAQRPERVLQEVLRPLRRDQRNPSDAVYVEQTSAGPVQWVASQALGAGRVVLVGADLLAEPFRTDANEWWRTLAGWPDPATADGPGPDPALAVADSQTDRGWQGEPLQSAFTTAIAAVKPAQDIPFGWLALFLGIYVLLVGPVDYLILKRINRLEWTFVTFTVITVLVTGSAWGVSQYLKGGNMLLRAVEIHTSRADTVGARSEAVWGVFSNAHDELTIDHTDPTSATAMFWVPPAEQGGSMGKQCTIESTAKGVFTPVAPVRIWTTDWFHSVWSNGRPAVIEGSLTARPDGQGCGGLLKLAADRDWRQVYCLYNGWVWPVTTQWRAGEEIRVQPNGSQSLQAATKGWERPPGHFQGELYPLESAAWNVMAASVGRRVGAATLESDNDRWAAGLACRPPAGWALILAFTEGDAQAYRVLRHTPKREALAVERVWVRVKPAPR